MELSGDVIEACFQAILGRKPTEQDYASQLVHGATGPEELGRRLMARGEFQGRLRSMALLPEERPQRSTAVFLGDRVLAETHLGFRIYLVPGDVDLTPHIIQRGVWEPHVEAVIRRLVKPGNLAVEVGANVGYHALSVASAVGPQGRLHVFEPNPAFRDLLDVTFYANGMQPWVSVHHVAVLDRNGTVAFGLEHQHFGSGNVVPVLSEDNPYHRLYPRKIEVEAVTLDSCLPEGAAVDFLRMDIEGSELLALRGAAALLQRSPRIKILAEWSVGGMSARADVPAAVDWILSLGFRFWLINHQGGLEPIGRDALLALPHSDVVMSRDDVH